VDAGGGTGPGKSGIESRFEELVTTRGTDLAGYVYSPSASRTYYITVINILNRSGTAIPGGMTNLVKADMYNPADPDVLNIPRLKWMGGLVLIQPEERDNLQIAYKTEIKSSADPEYGHRNAIAEIALLDGGVPPDIPKGWKVVKYNNDNNIGSNPSNSSETSSYHMYLIYRPVNKNDTRAIDFIGSQQKDAEDSSDTYIDRNYEWVTLH
jgi:hypothetical protein